MSSSDNRDGERPAWDIVVEDDKNQHVINSTDMKLDGNDKMFIEGCVRTGVSKTEAFFKLTKHRIDSKKGRILKPLVDAYFDDVVARDRGLRCPFTGLKSTDIMTIKVVSGSPGNVVHVGEISVAVSPGVKQIIETFGVQASVEIKGIETVPVSDLESAILPGLLVGSKWG